MDNIITSSDLISSIMDMASSTTVGMPNVWKKVVSKIKTYNDNEDSEKHMSMGLRLAANTRVIDLKNGILLVETDHPGWIQYLNVYKKFIINGIKREIPDIKLNTLAFRVKGSDFCLADNYDKAFENSQKKQQEKIEKDEKILEEYTKVDDKKEKKELPPELKEKFDSLINSMLTSSEDK